LKEVILIISTDATRTGTPLLLLNTLKWLKRNSDFKFVVILHEGGELLDEFHDLCDVYLWPYILSPGVKSDKRGFLIQGLKTVLRSWKKLVCSLFVIKLRFKYSVKLIYSNTARNGYILYIIRKFIYSKIILYVHEGERTLTLFNANGLVNYSIKISDIILTVSESVKQTLQNKYGVLQNIIVIPGGIEASNSFTEFNRSLLRNEGIGDDKQIIMCCGWLDWHKGTDLFIQIASSLSELNKNLTFVWIGGQATDLEYKHMKFDIDKLDLSDSVKIITSKPNAIDYISCADIFLMLSREESFSIVTLEAGLAKKPVLCFDSTGGPLEIVDFDQRFIVPYLDIKKMCERIMEILHDKDQQSQMGNYLYNRVVDNYSIEKCASSILEVLKQELVLNKS
jgi:glycosyltransferase involved in cell wall biosynthesis